LSVTNKPLGFSAALPLRAGTLLERSAVLTKMGDTGLEPVTSSVSCWQTIR
jgi:hypothetical protein